MCKTQEIVASYLQINVKAVDKVVSSSSRERTHGSWGMHRENATPKPLCVKPNGKKLWLKDKR